MEEVKLLFHDTETTGVDAEDRIIESAHMLVDGKGKPEFEVEMFHPPDGVHIKPMASATHGYTKRHIEGKPLFSGSDYERKLREIEKSGAYYVAHNAFFDLEMLRKERFEWPEERVIDTLSVAKHLLDADSVESHSLQYLRYYLELDETEEFEAGKKLFGIEEIRPHTAFSDVFVLWQFFRYLVGLFDLDIEEMVRLTYTPAPEKKVGFGNVFPKGEVTYDEAVVSTYEQYGKLKQGHSYLDWAVQNMDMSVEREFAIKQAMARALLNGKIPYIPEYVKYVKWGILFVFSKEEADIAIRRFNLVENIAEKLNILYTHSAKKISEKIRNGEEVSSKERNVLKLERYLRLVRSKELGL